MKRFKNILYFADSSKADREGLGRAVALAQANQARLTVMDVTPTVSIDWDIEQRYGIKLSKTLQERRLNELEVLTEPYADAGIMIYTHVVAGTAFIEVIRAVQRSGYDLLIKSARPAGGLADQFFGSNDMHLLRKCPCPVWIDRPASAHPYATLLAAVDPTDPGAAGLNRHVLDLITSVAEREGARIEVVHAWQLEGESLLRGSLARIPETEVESLLAEAEQTHRRLLNELLEPYGVSEQDPNVSLVKGEAAAVIAARAAETRTDLIVMGTVGRTGVPGLFIGNTAEDVLKSTCTSVLAVKPEGFVSPVAI